MGNTHKGGSPPGRKLARWDKTFESRCLRDLVRSSYERIASSDPVGETLLWEVVREHTPRTFRECLGHETSLEEVIRTELPPGLNYPYLLYRRGNSGVREDERSEFYRSCSLYLQKVQVGPTKPIASKVDMRSYFFVWPEKNIVKIGETNKRVQARCSHFETKLNLRPGTLVVAFDSSFWDEGHMHAMFSKHALTKPEMDAVLPADLDGRTEWFRCEGDLTSFLSAEGDTKKKRFLAECALRLRKLERSEE